MRFGKSQNYSPTDLRSFLGEGTKIIGDVKFTEIMRVDAQISGTVWSEVGSLVVMEKGHIKADIEVGSIEVGGTVEGKIVAKTSVKLLATGRVYGDIYTPALIIEYGAVFDGKCNMINGKAEAVEEVDLIEQKGTVENFSFKIADAR